MARAINRLSPRFVATTKKSGRHADGGGLYLQVSQARSEGVTKSWLYRFMLDGKARQMGLGPLTTVSLQEARADALECRKLVKAGIDPIDQRERERQAARAVGGVKTFKQCAEAYLKAHSATWRNAKHRRQWEATLDAYVHPILGERTVDLIDTGAVLEVLEPIWTTKNETASRIRGRVEVILDWASVRGYREGENPARWRGHLDKTLPRPSRVQKVRHHPAMPYAVIGAFMSDLRNVDAVSARALEFLILTAARTGEVIGATWGEIDRNKKIWTIAAERMKAGREHRVPLTPEAAFLIDNMPVIDGNPYIFPGVQEKRSLSSMALLQLLKRMDRGDVTAHGFRSSFRDWAAEQTNFPRAVAERALAHGIRDKTAEAYQRGDLFEKRRRLMEAWASYCGSLPSAKGKVIPLQEVGNV